MKYSICLFIFVFSLFCGCHRDNERALEPGTENEMRIISLAPSITEWVKFFNASEILVGCTDFCRTDTIQKVGGLTTPSLETILKLKPTHILASNLTPIGVLEQLKRSGAEIHILDFESLKSIRTSAETISQLVSSENQPKEILQAWDQAFNGLSEKKEKKKSIDVVVLFGSEGLYSAGKGTYIERMVELAGAVNVPSALNSSWPQIAEEKFIEMNPDLLIVHYEEQITQDEGKSRFLKQWSTRPQWPGLKAIKNNQILVMTDSKLSIPGPDLLNAFLTIQSEVQSVSSHSKTTVH